MATGEYTGTIPRVLAMGGFTAKAIIASGECDEEEEKALGGKFLGLPYKPREDVISMKIRTTIRAKQQRVQRGKPTSYIALDEDFCEEVLLGTETLTRRKVLSLVMSQYDPLGLLAPLLLQAKLLIHCLYGKGQEAAWDKPLDDEQAAKWAALLQEANKCPDIEFPRQLTPAGGERPHVIGFWDGSLEAFGACLYLRWEMPGREAEVRLITSKCRVAPIGGSTVQRLELQGMTVCARLVRRVVEALSFQVAGVSLIGDSICCIMAL